RTTACSRDTSGSSSTTSAFCRPNDRSPITGKRSPGRPPSATTNAGSSSNPPVTTVAAGRDVAIAAATGATAGSGATDGSSTTVGRLGMKNEMIPPTATTAAPTHTAGTSPSVYACPERYDP